MAGESAAEWRAHRAPQLELWARHALRRMNSWSRRVPGLRQQSQPAQHVGISVSAQGISLASVQRAVSAAPRLTRCEFHPLSRQADPGLALRGLMADASLEGASYRLVLNPDEYQMHLVESPDVPDSELREAVRWRIRDLIDFPVDEATVDVFDMPQQAGREAGRMMCVVVTRTPVIAQKAALVNRGSGQLEVIDIPDLALRNVMALTPADEAGAALLYIDAASSMILITAGKALYLSRRIWIGQQDLAGIAGREPHDDACRRIAEALAMELTRSLEYYETHFSRPPLEALYLAPLGAVEPALQQYLGQAVGLRVEGLDLSPLLDVPGGLSAELQARTLLAIGAALRQERATL